MVWATAPKSATASAREEIPRPDATAWVRSFRCPPRDPWAEHSRRGRIGTTGTVRAHPGTFAAGRHQEWRSSMRMLLTAMNCPKGDLVSNLAGHRDLLADGRSAGCRLVLLPEMSLTGYQPSAAIGLEHPAVQELVAATGAGPALGLGMVEQPADGGKPYITHVVAAAGRIITVHRKAGLGEDEHADFRPGEPSGLICVVGLATSIAVCAEIGTAPPTSFGRISCWDRQLRGSTGRDGSPTRTGNVASTGGARRPWPVPTGFCVRVSGLRSPPRPAPPTMRTSRAGPH